MICRGFFFFFLALQGLGCLWGLQFENTEKKPYFSYREAKRLVRKVNRKNIRSPEKLGFHYVALNVNICDVKGHK